MLVEPSSGGPGDPSLIWGSVRFVRTHARDHHSALDARPDRDHPNSTIKKPGLILPLALPVRVSRHHAHSVSEAARVGAI